MFLDRRGAGEDGERRFAVGNLHAAGHHRRLVRRAKRRERVVRLDRGEVHDAELLVRRRGLETVAPDAVLVRHRLVREWRLPRNREIAGGGFEILARHVFHVELAPRRAVQSLRVRARLRLARVRGLHGSGGDDLRKREHLGELVSDSPHEIRLLQKVGAGEDDGLHHGFLRLVGGDHVRVVQHVRGETQQAVSNDGAELRAPNLELIEEIVGVVDEQHRVILLLRRRRLRRRLALRELDGRAAGLGNLPLRARELEAFLNRRFVFLEPRAEALAKRRGLGDARVDDKRVHRRVGLHGANAVQTHLHQEQLPPRRDGSYRLER